jgi:ankyrin repeat protein
MEDAINQNNIEAVKYLLEQGYNPNSKTETDTPLIFTTESLEILNLLLDFGADPKLADENGFTMEDYCAENDDKIKLLRKERNTLNVCQSKLIRYNETIRLKKRRAKTLRSKITKSQQSD